jgi:hypothetical protein
MSIRTGGLALILAITAAGLSACGEREDAMVNPHICADFKATDTASGAAAPADAAAPVDTCVRRWAYSLAGAREGADVVATAAVTACDSALSHWNLTATDQAAVDDTGATASAQSLITGQPTDAMAEHAAFAQRQALLYVIEARAGRCKAPPAAKGMPIGA